MRKFFCVVWAALGLVVAADAARAATITETVDFVASNFTSLILGTDVPIKTVTGSITFTLDPTLAYHDETNGVTVNHIDVAYTGAPKFDYDPVSKFLVFGAGTQANGSQGGIPDFNLSIFLLDPSLQGDTFIYTVLHPNDDAYSTNDVTISFSPALTTTPIPSAAIMLVTALSGLVVAARRKRRHERGRLLPTGAVASA
jgi:hypothetical protein